MFDDKRFGQNVKHYFYLEAAKVEFFNLKKLKRLLLFIYCNKKDKNKNKSFFATVLALKDEFLFNYTKHIQKSFSSNKC